MNDERELERHNRILEQIQNAKTREDLPTVSFATISSYLSTNVYFENRKLSQTEFKPVVNALIDYGFVTHPSVGQEFIKVVLKNYPDVSEQEIIEKYNSIIKCKRISYILHEIGLKNIKLDEINKRENEIIHQNIIKQINSAYEIKDLPKVGLSELNKRLVKAVNENDFNRTIKISEIKDLTNAYLNEVEFEEIETIIENICEKEELSEENKNSMFNQIIGALIMDETILQIVEEINKKEERKNFIYKNDHELTIERIKEARRISELPQNLTVSTLTSYLLGNTTIYSKDNRIKSEDLKILTNLLLEGNKWEDEVVKNEVRKITEFIYSDKEDAFELLYDKLSKLPKTYYYVEEINYSQERQIEFIGNSCSNVNVYFIPNDKSPIDGGRFYNCYINRVQNLDLSEILPLDLDEIIPPSLDIDSIEWYVRENYDDTFKIAGGIILNKDETIGNVNVFKPNDGKVGISVEEKQKMDEIENLDNKITEKQLILNNLDMELEEKKNLSINVEGKVKELVKSYEIKALALQMELLNSISELKRELNYEEDNVVENYEEDNTVEKGLN